MLIKEDYHNRFSKSWGGDKVAEDTLAPPDYETAFLSDDSLPSARSRAMEHRRTKKTRDKTRSNTHAQSSAGESYYGSASSQASLTVTKNPFYRDPFFLNKKPFYCDLRVYISVYLFILVLSYQILSADGKFESLAAYSNPIVCSFLD